MLGVSKAASERSASPGKPRPFASGPRFHLYQGDCVEILRQLPAKSVDLIFADPPYFLSNGGFTCHSGRRAPVDKADWDKSQGVEEDHSFAIAWLSACRRVLKPSGTLWVSGTQHVIFSVGFALQCLEFRLLNTVTWYKPNASPNLSCRYFTHSTEILIWASPQSRGKLLHHFNYREMKRENGGKQMRDVWALPAIGEGELRADGQGRVWSQLSPRKGEKVFGKHPTQKPLALLERIVGSCTGENALVLDPFSGSGTTGVAALRLGRRYIGIDTETEYLALSQQRLRTPLSS